VGTTGTPAPAAAERVTAAGITAAGITAAGVTAAGVTVRVARTTTFPAPRRPRGPAATPRRHSRGVRRRPVRHHERAPHQRTCHDHGGDLDRRAPREHPQDGRPQRGRRRARSDPHGPHPAADTHRPVDRSAAPQRGSQRGRIAGIGHQQRSSLREHRVP